MKKSYILLTFLILLGSFSGKAQQDPQFTQYMYNTQVVNPAYAGNRDVLSFGLLYRTQWVGVTGAPKTATLTADTPIGKLENMGLGLSIVRDELGPSVETNITVDYSYSLSLSDASELSFGLKGGFEILDVDFSKLNIDDGGDIFENNIDNKVEPQIGAGLYFNTNRFYAGLSVPNFLTTKHFDESDIDNPDDPDDPSAEATSAEDQLHYFFIAGYVFDLSENLKFKPATFVKAVKGAPIQVDLSANFLILEKFTVGVAYRLDAAWSAMLGFQATDQIFIGFGYDYDTTDIQKYHDGSYEFMVRFDIFNKPERVLTPRFF